MRRMIKRLENIENMVMIITFVIMVVTSFVQVINRNFTKLSIPWLEEAAVYCMIYMVLIGTEIGLRDGTQIAVTSVVDKLGMGTKKIVAIISKTIVVIFSLVILSGAIRIVNLQIQTSQTSPALHLPMGVPYFALVLSFSIISIVQIVELITLVVQRQRIEDSQEEN